MSSYEDLSEKPDLTSMQWEILRILASADDYMQLPDLIAVLQTRFPVMERNAFIEEVDASINNLWKRAFVLLPSVRFASWDIEDVSGLVTDIRVMEVPVCLGEDGEIALKM